MGLKIVLSLFCHLTIKHKLFYQQKLVSMSNVTNKAKLCNQVITCTLHFVGLLINIYFHNILWGHSTLWMLSLWGLLTYFYNWEVTYAYILCFVDKQFIHVRMMYSQNIWVRVLYVIANIFDSEFCCSSPYSTCLFTVVFVLEYCSILNDKIRNMHNWCQYQGWLASSYQVSSIQLTHPLYIFRTIDSPQMNTNIHVINT